MQNKNIKFIFIIFVLVFLANSSCTSQSVPSSITRSSAVDQSLPNPTQTIQVPQPIEEKTALYQTVSDIAVEITSVKRISTGLEVGICYTAPDNGEWRPLPGHLFFASSEVYPDEIEFLPDEKIADGKNTGIRCALIRYLVEDVSAITTPLMFSIIQFYAPGREMYSPCEEFEQRLSTNQKANAYEIKAKCEEVGDGNISVELVDNDKSIAKDKVSKLLADIAKGEVAGPWEFTITEIEK
ncbi:MAG: hypothetical protein IPP66_06240 [Anaerolineales bacterium]|nr:hypothetical protein [Anaerolineales bacterium]